MAGVGPQVVQVLDFATARAPELQALHELAQHERMRSCVDAKLVSQRNQRRRRANAFKSHQMPRRLRLPRLPEVSGTIEEEELIALGGGSGRGRRSSVGQQEQQQQLAATRVAAMAKSAKRQEKRDQRPRCRKHRRRMHKMLEERSWLTSSMNGDKEGADAEEAGDAAPKPKWLSTHAWHAKRMLMRERYGHMLAQHRQDKGVSAALTALRTTATLHDASYYGVLELFGRPQLILEALQLMSDPSGSQFDEMKFLSGREEGRSMLYHEDQFPMGAIAPVTFMWRPLQADFESSTGAFALHSAWQSTKRQLWLWVHPAAFMEAATAIASACQSVLSEHSEDERIDILDRRGHVCRLKLRGKAANAMLQRLLLDRPTASSIYDDMDEIQSDHEDGFDTAFVSRVCATSNWNRFARVLTAERHSTVDAAVFAVTVQDPRVSSSKPKAKTQLLSLLEEPDIVSWSGSDVLCPLSGIVLNVDRAEEPDSDLILKQLESLLQWTIESATAHEQDTSSSSAPIPATLYPRHAPMASGDGSDGEATPGIRDAPGEANLNAVPCSTLWSLSGRKKERDGFHKDHDLNQALFQERRNHNNDDSNKASSARTHRGINLLAIQQSTAFPHTGGWDLILHPVYAAAMLNALVFTGAMVVGLDEVEAMATVAHTVSFPRDFPDTSAGRAFWDDFAHQQKAIFDKKPKAKRVAYDKLGIDSPFQPKWELLFDTQSPVEVDDDVESELCVLRGATYMEPFPFNTSTASGRDMCVQLVPVAIPTLVRVIISVPRRGTLEPMSLLYLPSSEDLDNFRVDTKWSGRDIETKSVNVLPLLGIVSSAVYDRPKAAFRAIAFCACEPLQRLFLEQGSMEVIALTRTISSRQLRPVRVEAAT